MKRILSIALALTMLLSSISAFAQSIPFVVDPITVTYSANAEKSSSIVVKGDYDESLVMRVFDENNNLIYIGTTSSSNNEFAFDAFQLGKPNVGSSAGTYSKTYNFVFSDNDGVLETVPVTFDYKVESTGGGGGGTAKEEKIDWAPYGNVDEKTGWGDGERADIDDMVEGKDSEKLWEKIKKVTTTSAATSAISSITKATPEEALKWETVRNNVAVAGETMTANISAKKVSVSKGNKLNLSDSAISTADLSKLDKTMAAIEKSIKDNKITLNREMAKELVLNVKFNNKTKATIAISKKLVDKLIAAKVDLLTIKDSDFRISYTIAELLVMLGDNEEMSFEVDKSGLTGTTKKVGVNFDTNKTQAVKISFPGLSGETKYMAVVDENGNPIGGRYNPATGVIEAKITESGVYQVVYNEKDFVDIKDKSEEMQESIKILASKGIIEGTSTTEFSPDDTISRAEIAALILRVLSQVDPNANGNFADVKKTDWFYGTAGSAKAYGMIVGFEDNTFRGNDVIAKDQILTIASRVLQREMRYKAPENVEEWLAFSDATTVANWAKNDIALATMANIITRTVDNKIYADEDMTRGDAALIIMRLFYKIW